MSPRAACRLERLGFQKVYDYELGLADWKAAGLPTEGGTSETQLVADATRTDIPTCELDERLGEVRARTFGSGWEECVVLDCDRVVIGRLRRDAWDEEDQAIAESVMEPGPTTVRPDGPLEPLVERMGRHGTRLVLVTTPQGALMGAVLRDEAERILAGESPTRIWRDCEGCPGRWASAI